MKVSGEIVAMNATAWHRSQIQTFCYQQADGTDLHLVRDLTKSKSLWAEEAPRSQHDEVYARKMLVKERAEADIIADRINTLMGNS